MILWIIIILMVLFICSMTLIKPRLLRWITSLILVGGLLFTIGLLTAHMTTHWGMKRMTTTRTQRIYSAGSAKSPVSMLITKRLGTNAKRYVLVYRNQPAAKVKPHFVPNQKHVVTAVKKRAWYHQANVQQATVKSTTKRWYWRSKTAKFWLEIGTLQTLISKNSVVTVPRQTWLVLTSVQAKKLAKIQQQKGSQITIQLKNKLIKKIVAYRQEHPKATAVQLKHYTQKQTTILTVQQLRQALK